ncbi:MAG TPA: RagB/SusD family nutrient uptake outer membrane protein, partial [Bacteroidia bacterium]|nr:RagB/SusD family nutrient uptake outer membrane protein [Bacteroidia bacterium]
MTPKYGLNAESVYSKAENYRSVLAKIYGGLILTGNRGPAGSPDFGTGDEGFSSFIRALWNLQELPTDEAVCGWTDPGIPDLNQQTWSNDNSFVTSMYQRIYFEIAMCNEFIRET